MGYITLCNIFSIGLDITQPMKVVSFIRLQVIYDIYLRGCLVESHCLEIGPRRLMQSLQKMHSLVVWDKRITILSIVIRHTFMD